MPFVTKENTQDIYPLSPTQKGILFHSLYDDSTPVYFQQLAFTINGPLDIEAFKRAWNHIISITPVFRTVFKWANLKEPLQIVLKSFPIGIDVHDIVDCDSLEQGQRIEDFLQKDRVMPFDMENGPLIRLNLFMLGNERHHFVWSHNHIIIDGWCLPIVLRDLFDAYISQKSGKPLPRPMRRPYKDYIEWLQNQGRDAVFSFWKNHLGDLDTVTPLPVDRRLNQSLITDIAEEELELSEEMTAKALGLTRVEHVTQNTLLQAVWAILLSYYSNRDEVVFGATSSGRPAELNGSDEMLGLFINTLPLRIRLNQDMTIHDLLHYIQRLSLSIREFEHSFLPDVRACSALPRSQNLFESIVVFENYPLESLDVSQDFGFSISDINTFEMTNFPLVLIIIPGSRIRISMRYYKALFNRDTIQRMIGHLHQVLSSILDNPGVRLSDLTILTPGEREGMLVSFNDTASPYPEDICAHQLIEEQAGKTPDAIAVIFEDEAVTYSELNERANRLAHYLRERGIREEARVGLMMFRSIDMIVGILGILKAGGAYVPLDPEYPKSRLSYMLSDCSAGIILSHFDLLDRIPFGNAEILCLNRDWNDIARMPESTPDMVNSSDNLAYIVYTSGSTGEPKGIEIEHKGLVNYITWAVRYYDIEGHGNFPLFTSISFDLTVTSIFVPLASGGSIDIQPGEIDPVALVERVICSDRCDIAKLTPSHLEIADRLTDSNPTNFTRLNRLIIGGDALSAAISKSMLKKNPDLTIYNEYGPAETVVGCIVYSFNKLDPNCANVPIGKPIANTRIYILDRQMRLMPIGMAGEIYISSPGVARGYLNKPDITSTCFVNNPFIKGERIYRTGDIGRWLPDGNVEFLGRIDHQIKIRGNRVELGEVEAVLSNYNAISDCVVVDRDDRSDGKCLVAYYVSEDELSTSELRLHIMESLPEFMVPSRFVHIENLPLTPNGKIDRDALPDVGSIRPLVDVEFVAPRNDMEGVLVRVWQSVLGLERVGVYDNFFELGGDSIISLQVVGGLKRDGYDIRPRDIFERQTIAELAPVVEESMDIKKDNEFIPGVSSLIPIQRWFFSLGLSNENYYNQSLVFRSNTAIDEIALKKSLQAILDHHDALRMRFMDHNQECLQPGEVIHCIVKNIEDQDELEEMINGLQCTLNITDGPIFGAGLCRMHGTDYLVLICHHLVMDGVSWRILLEDLLECYMMALKGLDLLLPAKTMSFREWAIRLDDYAAAFNVLDEVEYWKKELSALIPEFPIDHDFGSNDMASTEVIRMEFCEEMTSFLLRDAHSSYNTDINDLLLTALMRALQQWTGHDAVLIDLEGHGREDVIVGVDVSRTVGWFTSLFPVVLNVCRDEHIGTQIKYVKEHIRSIPHKGFNYGVLKHMRDDNLIPDSTSQVLFNYLGQLNIAGLQGSLELSDETNKVMASDLNNIRTHLIDISCRIENGRLLLFVACSRNKYRYETIHGFIQELKGEIENVVQHCMETDREGYTPSDFSLADISQEQLDDLIDELQEA
ncbi:MAG: amino acid adenylation domain-containing protein [Spirochaetota bacterium]|nr:amino acid adenylation domain-containing protein [Spirochaetota bacterium]